MIVVAVPVKDLTTVKQRLAALLTPAERAELARAMLNDVLRALARATGVEPWVVSRDAEVEAIARAHGARAMREESNRGHTAAVAFAQSEATRVGASVFVTVPGDVPCVSAAEIDALVVAARGTTPVAVFAASRSGLGTNGAALTPPGVMPLTFGEPSFANHLAAARRHGLDPHAVSLPGLALDVDTPDDIRALLADTADTESRRLVRSWPLADRPAAAALAPR